VRVSYSLLGVRVLFVWTLSVCHYTSRVELGPSQINGKALVIAKTICPPPRAVNVVNKDSQISCSSPSTKFNIFVIFNLYRATLCTVRICHGAVSVSLCPYVGLPVTFVYCVETNTHILKLFQLLVAAVTVER